MEILHIVPTKEKACFDSFTNLMRLAWRRDIRSLKEWSEDMASRGRERHKIFLRYAARMTRENFMANFRIPDLTYMNQEEAAFAVRFAPYINEKNVAGIDQLIDEAIVHIEQNVNPKMVFLTLLLE